MKISLTKCHVHIAAHLGVQRAKLHDGQFKGEWKRKNYIQQATGETFEQFAIRQIEAVGAESAVSIWAGIEDFVPLNGSFKAIADVGNNIEVKYTDKPYGNLLVHQNDNAGRDIAILVTGKMPHYELVGWLPVHEAQRSHYFRPDLDCYLVPRDQLKPMEDLMMIGDSAYGKD